MTEVIDLDAYEIDPMVAYGGTAGQKQAIWSSTVPWMVKWPHVYETLGIPVHDTVLGKRSGKIAVACRDFTNGAG